jgi:hypothetical protein
VVVIGARCLLVQALNKELARERERLLTEHRRLHYRMVGVVITQLLVPVNPKACMHAWMPSLPRHWSLANQAWSCAERCAKQPVSTEHQVALLCNGRM